MSLMAPGSTQLMGKGTRLVLLFVLFSYYESFLNGHFAQNRRIGAAPPCSVQATGSWEEGGGTRQCSDTRMVSFTRYHTLLGNTHTGETHTASLTGWCIHWGKNPYDQSCWVTLQTLPCFALKYSITSFSEQLANALKQLSYLFTTLPILGGYNSAYPILYFILYLILYFVECDRSSTNKVCWCDRCNSNSCTCYYGLIFFGNYQVCHL